MIQSKSLQQFSTFATRIQEYQKLNVFTKFSRMAMQTKSVNLGQGFPDYKPPEFIRQAMSESSLFENLDTEEAQGNIELRKSIQRFLEPNFKYKLDWETQIVVSHGATTSLWSVMQAIVDPGDEVIIIDPSFEIYRPLVEFCGGKCVSVQIKPKMNVTKDMLRARGDLLFNGVEDDWELDWKQLHRSLNERTKAILINVPNNPTGKVFNYEELSEISKLLSKYERVQVISDEAYAHVAFDPNRSFRYPRPAEHPGLADRTVTIFSIGKFFSCTGLRLGFCVGNEHLIKAVSIANQQSLGYINPIIQVAAAKGFDQCSQNGYFQGKSLEYQKKLKHLVTSLIDSKYDIDIWLPQGGYFVVTDVSRAYIEDKYFLDKDTQEVVPRDTAFINQLVDQHKIVGIPMTTFYDQELRKDNSNYVRFAFCKDDSSLEQARIRLLN